MGRALACSCDGLCLLWWRSNLSLAKYRRKFFQDLHAHVLTCVYFHVPFMRQRQARICTRYNDSILIYSNQELRARYRFSRASTEYITNLIEADIQRKMKRCDALTPIDRVLVAPGKRGGGGGTCIIPTGRSDVFFWV